MREKDRKALDALARARPGELDPERLAGSPRQHSDLAGLMAGQPAWTTARVTPRRRMLVPAVGIAAAAAVVISGIAVGVARDQGTQVSAAGPDGHLVLLSMANSVQNQASSGPYWQIATQSRYLTLVPASGTGDSKPYVLAQTSQSNWSIGVLPGEQSVQVDGINDTSGPWTTLDTDRWISAGSPATVGVDEGGGIKKGMLVQPVGGGKPSVLDTDSGQAIVALGSKNVTYTDLRQLPGDQAELSKMLIRLWNDEGGARENNQASWMFTQVGNLITYPVSNTVRASAYRILAGLPGITSLGAVTDPLGRGGVGVALPAQQYNDLGVEQQQLIVDPASSTILAQQTVLLTPSALANDAGMKAGTVLYYTATTHIGWTDQQAAIPTSH